MACDTFVKIAKKCSGNFVNVHAGEESPLNDEILKKYQLPHLRFGPGTKSLILRGRRHHDQRPERSNDTELPHQSLHDAAKP